MFCSDSLFFLCCLEPPSSLRCVHSRLHSHTIGNTFKKYYYELPSCSSSFPLHKSRAVMSVALLAKAPKSTIVQAIVRFDRLHHCTIILVLESLQLCNETKFSALVIIFRRSDSVTFCMGQARRLPEQLRVGLPQE
eukprot:SAG22_NODE_655_length_8104_cov_6.498438_8_plen_136_part_00